MHEENRQGLRESALGAPGDTDRELREDVWRFVAERSGGEAGATVLPGTALPDFVDTVARRAHESTEAQVEALRAEGYADEAILEITVVTAVSAGLTRLDRALEALKEDA